MAINFEDLIQRLKNECGADDNIINLLLEHRGELEDCADMSEALDKVLDIIKSTVASGSDDTEGPDEIKLSAAEQEYMERAVSEVEDFLKSKEWHYSTRKQRPDLAIFEMSFTMENCSLRARIYVEANPEVCRVDAILPITGDALYEYPLCEKITKFNYMKRFGSLKYDERDGEITYEYSFLSGHQIYPDELNRYLRAVLSSADDAYAEIKKCCVGRFKSKEVNEILTKVNALVEDISDD